MKLFKRGKLAATNDVTHCISQAAATSHLLVTAGPYWSGRRAHRSRDEGKTGGGFGERSRDSAKLAHGVLRVDIIHTRPAAARHSRQAGPVVPASAAAA